MIPTARLWASLCLLALPALLAGFIPELRLSVLLLDAGVLGLAAVDFALTRKLALEVLRTLPAKLSVGVANPVTLSVRNRGRRTLTLQLHEDLPETFTASVNPLSVVVPGRSRAELSYRLTPTQRGRFELGDISLRAKSPLGFFVHEHAEPTRTRVSVYPDLRGASRLLLSGAALDLVNLGLRRLSADGRGSEFARLRDYSQGDSQRDVDWKATARRQRPVTRVLETERSQSVLICIDAGRSMAGQMHGLSKLDHAVNAALFLAFVALRNGDRVGLCVFADGVKAFVAPQAGRGHYRRIVETLYAAKPQLTYVDYPALFKALSVRLRRRTLLCLFTDYVDPVQSLRLIAPLRQLSRRHVALCLSLQDPAVESLLDRVPRTAELAFEQAAASELQADREQLKTRMVQTGIQLVDVQPEELSLAAVNRYLDLKARGRL